MKFLNTFIFLFSVGTVFSQKAGKISTSEVYYIDDPVLNITLEKTEGPAACYKKNFPYSSCNLYFYKDSTFVFYYVDMETYDMSVGRYFRKDGIRVIQWDSVATLAAISDPSFYNKYFKFKAPSALRIEKAAYTEDGDQLVPFNNSFGKDKVELLYNSRDFLSKKMRMAEFKGIGYDITGKHIFVDYNDNKRLTLLTDSLWGFVTFKRAALKIYRTTPKGFNWYSFPGIQVVETEPFIIYTIGEGRLYCYFSRDLDSKIYPLELDKVKKEFKDNPEFIEALTREIPTKKALSVAGKKANSFRILEIYKEAQDAKGVDGK